MPRHTSNITRRGLLRAGVGGVGAVGLSAIAGACGGAARRDDELRLAVIGTGKRGQGHLRALGCPTDTTSGLEAKRAPLEPIPGVRVVAVCDTFERNLATGAQAVEATFGSCARYVDYRELLEQEDLDAVVVATPDHHHTPVAIAAARAGCDSYVEKSVSVDVAETFELTRVLEETGRLVQVGFQQRQDFIHQQAASVIRNGHLGKVHQVQIFFNRGGEAGAWISHWEKDGGPPRDEIHWDQFLGSAPEVPYSPARYFGWRRYWDYGTGMSGDILTHALAGIEYMLEPGIPDTVTTTGGVFFWKDGRETPDQMISVFGWDDHELTVSFNGTLANSFSRQPTVYLGEEASMELDWRLRVYPDRFSRRYADELEAGTLTHKKPMIHLEDGAANVEVKAAPSELWLGGKGATLTTRPDGQVRDTTRLHHEDFVDAIRTRRQPSASLETTFASTIAAHMATISYREGRTVRWDRERLQII